MSVIHKINYNILNQENKNFIIDVYINDDLLSSVTHNKTQKNQSIIFEYDYKNNNNSKYSLIIVLCGKEQQHKEMELKNIYINNSIIDVNSGYYYPKINKFWNSLTEKERKTMKKKLTSHGGVFGWFGSVEYEYCILHGGNNGQHNSNNLIPKTAIKI